MRTLRDSMCAMNRSDSACCLCSTLTICFLSITSTLLGVIAVALPDADRLTRQASFAEEVAGAEHRHDGLPARLGEHRQFHPPFWMYMTLFAAVALREDQVGGCPYSTIFFESPAESRNACASKGRSGADHRHENTRGTAANNVQNETAGGEVLRLG